MTSTDHKVIGYLYLITSFGFFLIAGLMAVLIRLQLWQPEQAIVVGWPATHGAIAGVSLRWWGRDSLRGALLLDERLGARVRPGLTGEFVAGRAAP